MVLQEFWWRPTANAGLVDDIVNAIKNAATCATCQGLFVPLKVLATLGDGPFTKTFVAVCKVISVSSCAVKPLRSLLTYLSLV